MSSQSSHQTPDSYDAHIFPTETAARKNREGNRYKQIPENPESANSIDTTGGYTVDKEALVNNYATEPEIYSKTPGDLQAGSNSTFMTNTIIDTFSSLTEAESVVLKIQKAGLDTRKILIIGGKDYQDTDFLNRASNWQDIDQASGVAAILVVLGISRNEALKHETEVKAGKFVVLVMGSDEDVSQTYQIFHNIGHRIREATTA